LARTTSCPGPFFGFFEKIPVFLKVFEISPQLGGIFRVLNRNFSSPIFWVVFDDFSLIFSIFFKNLQKRCATLPSSFCLNNY